jgi:hypothetical protein
LFDGGGKIAFMPGDTDNLRQGMHFDIMMSTGFNHAGGDHAHGTVTGWEGFVQPGHRPTDGWFIIDHVHHQAAVGKVEGSLHASYA